MCVQVPTVGVLLLLQGPPLSQPTEEQQSLLLTTQNNCCRLQFGASEFDFSMLIRLDRIVAPPVSHSSPRFLCVMLCFLFLLSSSVQMDPAALLVCRYCSMNHTSSSLSTFPFSWLSGWCLMYSTPPVASSQPCSYVLEQ